MGNARDLANRATSLFRNLVSGVLIECHRFTYAWQSESKKTQAQVNRWRDAHRNQNWMCLSCQSPHKRSLPGLRWLSSRAQTLLKIAEAAGANVS
jgi:hypothetical protein